VQIDIEKGAIRYFDDPIGYHPKEWSGTDRIFWKESNMILLEQNGKRLLKYSLLKNECQYFDINCDDYICCNFAGAVLSNQDMYLFSRYRDSVLKIDLNTGYVKKKEKLCPDIEYEFNEKEVIPHMLFSCGCQIENHMWLFTESKGIAVDYDIEKEQAERHILPKTIESCSWAEYRNGLFYILSKEGKFYEWSSEKDTEPQICDFGPERGYPYFGLMLITGKQLWMLPLLGEKICIVDLETEKHKEYSGYPEDFSYHAPESWGKYISCCDDEKNYYLAMHSGNYILSINKKNGKERWIKPGEINEESKIDFILRNKRGKEEYEGDPYDIADFMRYLKMDYKIQEKITGKSTGKLIWNLTGRKTG